jgi:hypothetical protein
MANQQEVVSLCTFVSNDFVSLGRQILEAFMSQEQAMKEQDHQTGEVYTALAKRLLGESSSPVRTFRNPSLTLEEDVNLEEQDATTNRVMTRLRPCHETQECIPHNLGKRPFS